MNVWICNPFDNLEEEGARPQRYALLSAELARRGHAVTWWTSAFSHARKAPRAAADGRPLETDFINAHGVRLRLLETPPYARNVSVRRILSHRAFARIWLRQAGRAVAEGDLPRPELVVTSLPPLATHAAARALRDAFACRLAVDVQDAWPEAFEGLLPLPAPLRRLAARLLFGGARAAARRAYLSADCITAVSAGYLDGARAAGAEAPMAAFRLGIADVAPSVRPVAEGPVRLFYGGNMGVSYDLATLVEAVRALDAETPGAWRLDLAGTGPAEKVLRRRAAECGAIVFHGFLRRPDYEALLGQAEIGVIPMFARSCVAVPNKFADYAAAGLAVLSCLPGETEALVAASGAGETYRARDVQGLIAALRRLAANRETLLAARQNALALARREFLADAIYPAMAAFILA